jgi:hypothetical protein
MLADSIRHRGPAFSCRCAGGVPMGCVSGGAGRHSEALSDVEAATSPTNHALTSRPLRHDRPHQQLGSLQRIGSEAPGFFGGSCRIASPARISDLITVRHIGIRWFSAPLAAIINSADLKRWAGRSGGTKSARQVPRACFGGNALGVTVDIGNRPSPVGSETT